MTVKDTEILLSISEIIINSQSANDMVESLSKASLVAGCDGLLIETHYNPCESKCDADQTIDINTLSIL